MRSFVAAQTAIVGRGSHRKAQQILIIVHRCDDSRQKQQEHRIFKGIVSGLEQIQTGVRFDGPVVVLARTVHAPEGFFV